MFSSNVEITQTLNSSKTDLENLKSSSNLLCSFVEFIENTVQGICEKFQNDPNNLSEESMKDFVNEISTSSKELYEEKQKLLTFVEAIATKQDKVLKLIANSVPTDECKRTLNRNSSSPIYIVNPVKSQSEFSEKKIKKPKRDCSVRLNDCKVAGKEKNSKNSENLDEFVTFEFDNEQYKQERFEINSVQTLNEHHIAEVRLDAKSLDDISLENVKVEISKESDIKQSFESIDGELLDETDPVSDDEDYLPDEDDNDESTHVNPEKLVCQMCGTTFKRKANLQKHVKNATCVTKLASGAIVCDICGKSYPNKNSYRYHKRLHINWKKMHELVTLSCEKCVEEHGASDIFTTRAKLRYHKSRMHRNPTNVKNVKHFQCEYCEKQFFFEASYENHKTALHSSEGRSSLVCSQCGKQYSSKKSLHQHEQTHGEPLLCTICGKSCSNKKNLAIHISTHSREKPYQCDQCDKAYTHESLLRSHVRYHKKSLSCDQCGKLFARNGSLKIHLLHHKKEYAFPCSFCGKRFVTKVGVYNHEKTHSTDANLYAHKCSYCERAFLNNSKLKRHERTHTKEKPYKCPHCDLFFSQTESRNSHIKKTHATTADDSLQSLNEASLSTTS